MSRQSVKSVNFASDEKRILFSVSDRSVITKALVHGGGSWAGSRRNYEIRFMYDKHAPKGQQVVWSVCISRHWKQGTAPMISDAMACVESKVANKALDARLDKLAQIELEAG